MGDAPALERHIGAQVQADGTDRLIAALAARQHGVVGWRQLAGLGIGRGAIRRRLEAGRLHPVHRGVFAVGHPAVSREGRWMAAVLSAGDAAVLSHRSAAALWRLRLNAPERTDVTVPRTLRSRPAVRLHCAALAPDELTCERGIPVSTPLRTLLDLAAVVPAHQLERAVNEAEILRLTDELSLADLLARYPRRTGTVALRRILDRARIGASVTRSELEDRLLAFLDRQGLPRPDVNAHLRIAGGIVEVDCLWRERRVIAELDGYATHATRAAFERDRARDRALQAAGWRVIRITWRQLHEAPDTLTADLAALLGLRTFATPSDG